MAAHHQQHHDQSVFCIDQVLQETCAGFRPKDMASAWKDGAKTLLYQQQERPAFIPRDMPTIVQSLLELIRTQLP